MARYLKILTIGIFCAGLAGCSVPKGAALSNQILKEQTTADSPIQVVSVTRDNLADVSKWPAAHRNSYNWLRQHAGPASPLIRTGDLVSVSVWDNQSNSLLTSETEKRTTLSEIPVSPSGKIFIPYLGDVEIRNMTPDAARQKIQTALEPIVPAAQVQLKLVAGQQNSVDMVGGVLRPGNYPLPNRNYTLLSLIAQSGGIQESLRNPQVRLIRAGQKYEIPASRLKAEPALDITLRGKDKVIIERDERYFTALGATGREELVYFPRESVKTLEALSMIGGLADQRADLKSIMILRDYQSAQLSANGPDKEQVVFVFDLTTADGLFAARQFDIQPMDTLLGTETVVTSARTVLGLIGAAIGAGNQLNNLTE